MKGGRKEGKGRREIKGGNEGDGRGGEDWGGHKK